MIRQPENYDNMRLNVFLKDGTEFIGKDITQQPMGEAERFISFWDGDIIKGYSMDLISHFEYTFDA